MLLHRQDFLASWDQMAKNISLATTITSERLGKLTIPSTHLPSLYRVVSSSHNLLRALYNQRCTPYIKVVAAGCKPIQYHVVYRKSGQAHSHFRRQTNKTVLRSISSPGEYFSALVGCFK
ncbi:hypothetical protein DSO57_1034990 [Entomophthora muscae]|uniref:Uncharacterized protein n=1 Tax=Entomophthora muscae TaxID=34485 RepID=A0ACC2REJ5_9FUNG|nr:hypothetical protein DSO57_1034990 [Entomophthora muscae]